MRPLLTSAAVALRPALAAVALLAPAGCSRSTPAAAGPRATPPLLEAASARASLARRSAAAAKNPAVPGVATAHCPLLLAPDDGAPVSGTLEEGSPVEVVLVEPGFFGIRADGADLAFVPARCVRLEAGPLEGTPPPRPRREILPQIIPLTPVPGEGATPPLPAADAR